MYNMYVCKHTHAHTQAQDTAITDRNTNLLEVPPKVGEPTEPVTIDKSS